VGKPITNRRITKGGITKAGITKGGITNGGITKGGITKKNGKTTNYNQKLRKCLNQTKTKNSNEKIHENGAMGINKLRTAGA
jgi:hypothetical protein